MHVSRPKHASWDHGMGTSGLWFPTSRRRAPHSSARTAPSRSFAKMASSVGSEATTIGDNVGLVAAMIAVVVAQVLKPFSDWTVTGRFKAGLMVGSGGFPSSHSSLVTALATGAAYQSGLGDPAFATALVLALVVRAAPSRVASRPPRDERQHPPRIPRPRHVGRTTARHRARSEKAKTNRFRENAARASPRGGAAALVSQRARSRACTRDRSVSDHHDVSSADVSSSSRYSPSRSPSLPGRRR